MPETNNIKSDELKSVARGQAVVEARQAVDGDCKVLSVSCTVSESVSEVFTGEARYTGKARFDCLVQIGTRTDCVSAIAEFSDKLASPDIVTGMKILLEPEVVNCEASSDGGAIKLIAVIDTNALAVMHSSSDVIVTPDDGIYAERADMEYCTVIAEPSETIYITDSASIKGGEVVCANSKAVVTGVDCADGEVKISGNVYTTVLTRADDSIINNRIVTPFVKSITAMGAGEGCIAYADVTVTDCVATVTEDNKLELSVTLQAEAVVFAHKQAQAIVDVFCADSVIETETAEIVCCAIEPQTTVTDAVDGQVTLAPDRLAADTVLCVSNATCALGSVKSDNGRVNVEGLVGGDIVYYNAEKNAVDTLAFRIPFAIPLSIHTDGEVSASATVTDVNVRVRRESVFDIKAEVCFTVRSSTCKPVTIVKSVKRGEPIARPDATIIVHIAKTGETLWQAAKALCCSPERVTEQNSYSVPYAGGERLVNFCKK